MVLGTAGRRTVEGNWKGNSGKILGALNPTVIALIHKKNEVESLDDYKDISLCN